MPEAKPYDEKEEVASLSIATSDGDTYTYVYLTGQRGITILLGDVVNSWKWKLKNGNLYFLSSSSNPDENLSWCKDHPEAQEKVKASVLKLILADHEDSP